MEFPTMNNFWDLSQTPSQFSQLGDDDFLALLQKQYPNTVPDVNAADGAVNPQSIQKPPLPGHTPPSDDSSPSPPSIHSVNHPRSRHQSTYSRGNDNEESALKRKASDDDMEEGPSSKNQHTADDPSDTKKGLASRRKSGSQDDTRLLKRKEQNRAAQRAFRERKEKHVKDLEDKVAALEAKNKDALNENSNLRDLLARLQEENLALKQAQFTFSMPKPIDHSQASSSASPSVQAPFSFFGSPPAVPQPAPAPRTSSPKPFSDIDWSSLTTFDPALLNAMDEIPSGPMQVDSSNSPYGQYALPAPNQYKTLATNTFFMSFADTDSNSFSNGPVSNETINNTSNGLNQFPFSFPSPSNSWNSTRNGHSPAEFSQPSAHSDYMQNHSLDELFGGTFMNGQGPVDFSTLMKSPPAPTGSPVTHANGNGNGNAQSPSSSISSQSSMASPLSAHPAPSPSSASTSNGQSPFSWTMSRQDAESPPSASEPSSNINPGGPIISREDIAKHIVASGDSPFTSPPFSQPTVRKTSDFSQGGSMISCEGSQFPKTKESPANIDVLKAWRTITSHPQFKDADINHLCTEFTKKARCDGTKVVLEPEGVHHILETFKAKSLAQQQQTSSS
ncbi:uncharacterized protein EDB93DRAFT_1114156 [Suillus bovinus]|uniref:uncharacterized protein n=1 Tax=Suillus bovinus TaxID=48563 RepID=UPI001B862ED4|nr:uncharacterized protein EDB93DRAFT_1114156 [Suillus bovinus]KAG2160228.1 hypothetical protein EDB93DRAFT_1114156 [Suillus bovinus]